MKPDAWNPPTTSVAKTATLSKPETDLLCLRPRLARPAQFFPVLFGLVGVEGAESGQRLGEAIAGAKVAGNRLRVAGAGVATSQQFAAEFGVGLKAVAGQVFKVDRTLVIVELAHQVI